jgi:hypothetical protein
MNNWITPSAYLSGLHGAQGAGLATEAAEIPASVTHFLARIRLLYGVPFNHLVPDSRLLPPESVRFFYIDRNFTDRLVDGALSVGKTTTREFAHAQANHGQLQRQLDEQERGLRPQLRNAANIGSIIAPQAADLTGLLMRSRAVSGWPGLEIKAYRNITAVKPTQLALLRMDRLAPDVMLCIFEGVPTRVDMEEPREGIQFGVDLVDRDGNGVVEPSPTVPSGLQIQLRKLRGRMAGQLLGTTAENPKPTPQLQAVPVRKGNRRVLHMRALRDALQTRLNANPDTEARADILTSGELALQLSQFPFHQRFEGNGDGDYRVTSPYVGDMLKAGVIAKPLQVEELRTLFSLAN